MRVVVGRLRHSTHMGSVDLHKPRSERPRKRRQGFHPCHPPTSMPRAAHLPYWTSPAVRTTIRSFIRPHRPSHTIHTRNFTSTTSFRRPETAWPYLYSSKTAMAPQLESYFKQVDSMAESFIDRLRKAVAIPSVSAADEHRPDVVKVQLLHSPRHSDSNG